MKENKIILAEFYKLYEEGRKKKIPRSYIDYFEASHFLLTEINKVRIETSEYKRERIKQNIGLLRQYLNERESDELITDEEIKKFIVN